MVSRNALRAQFAQAMSDMYGAEVGLYKDLVRITEESNADYIGRRMTALGVAGLHAVQVGAILQEEIGDLERVKGERHGAIRLASPQELLEITKIYEVLDMVPVGFYNLGATGGAAPVIATAGRPKDLEGKDVNPFRVFTSVLDIEALDWDKLSDGKRQQFIDKCGDKGKAKSEVIRLQAKMKKMIGSRTIFSKSLESDERVSTLSDSELGGLIDLAATRELNEEEADRFIALVTRIFAMSPAMVISLEDYMEFSSLHEVAADILAFPNPHINHLTPRALDIADAYERMAAEGRTKNFKMLKKVQGPAEKLRPVMLLKQTSYVSKPSWVYIGKVEDDVVEWLKKVETALGEKDVRLKYEGVLDLAKFGLALDNAGYNLEKLFGDEKIAFFTLGELQNALREKIEDVVLDDFPKADVTIVAHTARFGEIEQRGIALTPEGRGIYDKALEVAGGAYKQHLAKGGADGNAAYQRVAGPIFAESRLASEANLIEHNWAYYCYHFVDTRNDYAQYKAAIDGAVLRLGLGAKGGVPGVMEPLVRAGVVVRSPVIYEDFLPKSAAGIFMGNQRLAEVDGVDSVCVSKQEAVVDPKLKRFTDLGITLYVQYDLFAAQQAQSVIKVLSGMKEKGLVADASKAYAVLHSIVDTRDRDMTVGESVHGGAR